MFVFGDFNVQHKDWVTCSSGTDKPDEFCYNFSISNDPSQMVNFSTQIPNFDSHSPVLLNLFLSSDTSISSTMAFLSIGKFWSCCCLSFHWLSNKLKTDALFYHIAYDYSHVDSDGIHDHLRDVPWGDICKLRACAVANEFCDWFLVGIDLHIPHCKYQVKPHSYLDMFKNIRHFLAFFWTFQSPVVFLSCIRHYWSHLNEIFRSFQKMIDL